MKLFFCLPALLWAATAPFASAGSATWSANATSNDWNTAANWVPATVPNGPSDVATFTSSTVTGLSLSKDTEISQLTFGPGSSAYTVTVDTPRLLTIDAPGIVNNSGETQSFAVYGGSRRPFGTIQFTGAASAGEGTFFNVNGGAAEGSGSGFLKFQDSSSAASSTILVNGGLDGTSGGGQVIFSGQSSADRATIEGAGASGSAAPFITFLGTSTAAQANVTLNAAHLDFFDRSNVGDATITAHGGGYLSLGETVTAGAGSTLIADGGSVIIIAGNFDTRVELFNGGFIELAFTGNQQAVGSIEGDGAVFIPLGHNFTLGSNGLSTTFSGVLQDDPGASAEKQSAQPGGAVTKTGTGTLTLSGANTYTGNTTVSAGVLLANTKRGSSTGTGSVNVNTGTLGGKGMISGPVTIGTGSGSGTILAPSVGSKQPLTLSLSNTLTCQADSTYTCQLSTSKTSADEVIAKGVTIASGAQFALQAVGNKRLPSGTVFTAISNTSATPINGTFANLADGSTLTAGRNKLLVSYTGGDGNDLTLTVE